MIRIAICLLSVSSTSFGQNIERVFRLTHTTATAGQNEIATSLRTVAQIQKLSVDPVAATVTVQGSAAQIALAEWLVPRLDAGVPGPQNYNVAGDPNDIVMVYPFAHIADRIGLQEILTTVRTVLNIQKIYNISAAHTLVLRATAKEAAMVSFLFPRLDHVAEQRQAATVDHFHVSGDIRFDTLSVYGLAHANNNIALQQLITVLRTVADLQKIYEVTVKWDLIMRANQSDIQVAEWLIGRLDRQVPDPAQTELKMPGGKDDVIHVFYLSRITASNDIQNLSMSIRAATPIKKMYGTTTPAALVVRGTADSIAAAGRIVSQAENPK